MGKKPGESWDPEKENEGIERVVDNVKAETERQSTEWIGDAEGMVE